MNIVEAFKDFPLTAEELLVDAAVESRPYPRQHVLVVDRAGATVHRIGRLFRASAARHSRHIEVRADPERPEYSLVRVYD